MQPRLWPRQHMCENPNTFITVDNFSAASGVWVSSSRFEILGRNISLAQPRSHAPVLAHWVTSLGFQREIDTACHESFTSNKEVTSNKESA